MTSNELEELILEQQMGMKRTTDITREECEAAMLNLMEEEGLEPDAKKVKLVASRYSMDELTRMLDAFYRFGVRDILRTV